MHSHISYRGQECPIVRLNDVPIQEVVQDHFKARIYSSVYPNSCFWWYFGRGHTAIGSSFDLQLVPCQISLPGSGSYPRFYVIDVTNIQTPTATEESDYSILGLLSAFSRILLHNPSTTSKDVNSSVQVL
jgi:hypothetical protein